jgi:MIP family channel proteins
MKSKPFFAELIGTFALIFIGAGTGAQGQAGLVGVAAAHGLVIATFIYLFGSISGAHFNPAVTFALALNGTVEWSKAVFYWIAQFLGSVLAAALLLFVFGGPQNGLGATVPAVGIFQALAVEAVLTFLLANAVLFGAVAGLAGKRAGFVIGLTLFFGILMGGPLTGGSLNPARTLGPSLFTGNLDTFWIYLAGPLAGAALAALTYRFLKENE